MKNFLSRYSWMAALFGAGMKSLMADRKAFTFSALSMFGNNALYFVNWWLFFGMVGEVRGWDLSRMAVLYGSVAFAFGVTMFFLGGAREIVSAIESGRLDVYLGKPRHPLPALMLAEAKPYGLGDMATGPVLWFTLGGLSWAQGLVALVVGCAAGVVLLATLTFLHSLGFWKSGAKSLVDQLFDAFVIASSFPQNALPVSLKFILMTAIPAGFMGMVPAWAIFHPSILTVGGIVAAAAFYMAVAAWVFNRGLRHYTSGSMMVSGG